MEMWTRSRYWLEAISTTSRAMKHCASVSVRIRTPHKLTPSPAAAASIPGLYRREPPSQEPPCSHGCDVSVRSQLMNEASY